MKLPISWYKGKTALISNFFLIPYYLEFGLKALTLDTSLERFKK